MRRAGALALGALVLWPIAARGDDAAVKESCASAAERGQGERASRKLQAARADFIQCAAAACPSAVRQDCAKWLSQVEDALPTIVLRARDERGEDLIDVTVDLDGARLATRLDGAAAAVDPGPHTLHFEAPGRSPVDVKILITEGEKARSVVGELRPVVRAGTPRADPTVGVRGALTWVAFGLGAASLGAFVALEVAGHSELSELKAGCGATRTCSPEQVSPVRTQFQLAAVALGVGVASAAAGGVLLYVGSRDRSRPSAWIHAAPLVSGAGLSAGASF